MLLSQTGAYTLRAAIYLAQRSPSDAVPVAAIAEALGVPRNYLSKILHQLARQGVLVSERGPRGGFRLAPHAGELPLAQILEPVDPVRERRCLLGRPDCTDSDPCPLHERWQDLADGIEELLRNTTLAEIAHRTNEGNNHVG